MTNNRITRTAHTSIKYNNQKHKGNTTKQKKQTQQQPNTATYKTTHKRQQPHKGVQRKTKQCDTKTNNKQNKQKTQT